MPTTHKTERNTEMELARPPQGGPPADEGYDSNKAVPLAPQRKKWEVIHDEAESEHKKMSEHAAPRECGEEDCRTLLTWFDDTAEQGLPTPSEAALSLGQAESPISTERKLLAPVPGAAGAGEASHLDRLDESRMAQSAMQQPQTILSQAKSGTTRLESAEANGGKVTAQKREKVVAARKMKHTNKRRVRRHWCKRSTHAIDHCPPCSQTNTTFFCYKCSTRKETFDTSAVKTRLGFRIEEKLSSGKFGNILLATIACHGKEEKVALKVLPKSKAVGGYGNDALAIAERYRCEAEIHNS